MASNVTLLQLKTRAREKADMVNSQFVSDSELLSYINNSYSELYDILVSRFEDYYTEETSVTISPGSSTIPVPNDFYKLRGLDRNQSGNSYYSVHKYNWKARNRRNNQLYRTSFGRLDLSYRLVKDSIRILPEDSAPGTYRLWYIPTYTPLAADTDVLDGVNGFDEYIVIDVAMKMLLKEESDVSVLIAQKKAMMQRIEEMSQQRDADNPEVISDVSSDVWDNEDSFFWR